MLSFLMTAGKYATIIAGADITARAIGKLTEGTSVEPVISGFGDTVQSVLDPLDLTGYRAGKAKKAAAELDKAQDMAANANARLKAERKAREVAEAQAKEAKKLAAKAQATAEKTAREAEKKLAAARSEKDRIQAQRMADQAKAMARYGELAKSAADKSANKSNPSEGLAMATAALEFAKQAVAPGSAISAINAATTAEGKALAATVNDAVNRDDVEFDPEAVLKALERGDTEAFDAVAMLDGPDHSDEIAGSCCASCSMGAESCGGKRDVPAHLVNGEIAGAEDDEDADSFLSYFFGDPTAAAMIAGPPEELTTAGGEDAPWIAPSAKARDEASPFEPADLLRALMG